MTQTQQQDTGLVQRGLLLLGGMTALVVVVLLIALRGPETPTGPAASQPQWLAPAVMPIAAFPATPGWPLLVQLGQQLPSAPGWEIRYNAAVTLARRGSSNTPWPIIREMLDEERQLRNFRVRLQNGREVADEDDAHRTMQNALVAVAEWHKKQKVANSATVSADLQQVHDQVERLAQGTNTPLRVQADRVRQTFMRK